jgi:hypothetical protein
MSLVERLSAAWWDNVRGREHDLARGAATLPVQARYRARRSWILAFCLAAVAFFFWVLARFCKADGGQATVTFVLRCLAIGSLVSVFLVILLGGLGFEVWTIGQGAVTRRSGGLLGSRSWTEPLSAYTGVVSTRKQRTKGLETEGPYLVQLRHEHSPLRSVPLYCSLKHLGLHDKARYYGRLLHKPVLVATEHGIVLRAPEDIDKSVRELLESGRMSAAMSADEPPGGRPKLALRGDSLSMRVPRGALGPLRIVALPTSVGVVFMAAGFFHSVSASPEGAIASSVAAAFLTCLFLICIGEELQVSPERISRCWTWLGLRFGSRSVPADSVRDVIAAEQFSDARFRTVQIVSPGVVLHFGRSLKPAQRRWVRDCIIAVISR